MITVKEFIEKYNQHIDWNMEIRNTLNIQALESNPVTKEIINDYLSSEKITADKYEIENAQIYKYEGDNKYELQIYSFESYRTIYFWRNLDITKDEYIKERVSIISREAKTQFEEAQNKMKELQNDLDCLNILSQGLNI